MLKVIPTTFYAFSTLLFIGCASAPEEKPSAKYTIDVIGIDISKLKAPAFNYEELIHHPAVQIIEYPFILAEIGESVTNDQTEAISVATDQIVDGKAVAMEKTYSLGKSVEVTLHKLENAKTSLHLYASSLQLLGMIENEIDGHTVTKPDLQSRQLETDLTLPLNTWEMAGAQLAEDFSIPLVLFVRVTPPTNMSL